MGSELAKKFGKNVNAVKLKVPSAYIAVGGSYTSTRKTANKSWIKSNIGPHTLFKVQNEPKSKIILKYITTVKYIVNDSS